MTDQLRRWFAKQPAPLLGDDSTSYDDVMAFYDYWYNTESWREFGYFDEQGAPIPMVQSPMPCRSRQCREPR